MWGAAESYGGRVMLGLLQTPECWYSRAELAAKLYPDAEELSAKTALRQTLSRWRRWLGADSLQSDGSRIRLSADWESRIPSEATFHPQFDHPWLASLRLQSVRRPPSEDAPKQMAGAVRTVADIDRNVARGILVGGKALLACLDVADVAQLLSVTRPADRRDPYAHDHVELQGNLQKRIGALLESLEIYLRAHRLACHQPGRSICA